jgi:peptide subunit release factor RF-3
MNEKSVGQLFKEGVVQAAARALVYGAAVCLVTVLCMGIIKQEIKEGIEYGVETALEQTSAMVVDTAVTEDAAFNRLVLPKLKQNAKEAIEYTITRAKRDLIAAPPAKEGPKPSKHS